MKILFLTSRLPFPPIGGDRLRTFNFIKHLSKSHEVTILSLFEREEELSDIEAYKTLYHKLIPVKLSRTRSYLNCFRGLFSSLPLQVHYYRKDEVRDRLDAELRQGYDAVFCHLIRMAQYLPEGNHPYKIVDFTDAISLNYERSKTFSKGIVSFINRIESKRVFRYELDTIVRADAAIFISESDSTYLTTPFNADKIRIVPNGVDLQTFTFDSAQHDPNKIVFMGNMRTFPNADAAVFLGQHIFPLLQRRHPNLKLYVVGQEPTRAVRRLHDGKTIFVTGYVDSVSEHLQSAAAMVAPMRVGAGMKNKILEAMALGTPVVTTKIGAEGLDAEKMLVADTPEAIAQATQTLLDDRRLRREKARSARKYVEENFGWDKQLIQLEWILQNHRRQDQGERNRNQNFSVSGCQK